MARSDSAIYTCEPFSFLSLPYLSGGRWETSNWVWTARALSRLLRTPRWTLTMLAGVTLALGWGLG